MTAGVSNPTLFPAPSPTTSTTQPLTPTNVDALASLSGLLYGTQATNLTATGQAQAAAESAAGANAEAAAYGTAGAIATENEAIAGIAGQISLFQQQRQVAQSVGQATAAAGASGALMGGSPYDVIQSSYTQGAIGSQLIQVQTALDQGGYAQEAAATQAEVAAANAQAAAANTEAAAFTAQASLAAQQTAQLQSLYPTQTQTVTNLTNNPTTAVTGGPDSESYTAYLSGGSATGGSNTALHYNFGNLG